MDHYWGEPALRQRAHSLYVDAVNTARRGSSRQRADAVVDLLEYQLDSEVDDWRDPSAEAALEIEWRSWAATATWIALGEARWYAESLRCRGDVRRERPDAMEAWEEDALQVSLALGQSSGDWGYARLVLVAETEDLISEGGRS